MVHHLQDSEKGEEELDTREKLDLEAVYPLLPLKNTVIFPGVALTLNVGENRSKRLLGELKDGRLILSALKDMRGI